MNGTVSVTKMMAPTRAVEVQVTDDTLLVDLEDGRTISVPIGWYPRLAHGSPNERQNYQLSGGGRGIYWPDLDEDSLAQLQEEMAKTTAGPGMMAQDMMGPGMMNSHMDWQVEAPPTPGENPTWGNHGGNGGHRQRQGDSCCGWGMMRPGN